MGFIWDYMVFIGVAPSHNRSWCGLGMGLHQAITKKNMTGMFLFASIFTHFTLPVPGVFEATLICM
jgi:broad specificity polyphosphatase/5'/3'-nucleotidase SurE